MLLKSIKLYNFRQFKGEQPEIHFSTDDMQNVTVIMGDNGSGKTSLAQAFSWCLFGETDFKDKSMLNKIIAGQMLPEQNVNVRVEVRLNHSGTDYTIIREQVYKKEYSGNLKAQNSTFTISYKKNGQQEFLKPYEAELQMKQILPKELSRYFFFDGERIDNLSKELRKGKSKEFAQAVRGLLGLNAFIKALEHLKPTSKYGVIGSYNESYDSSSDEKIAKYTKEIDRIQAKLDSITNRFDEIENEIQYAEEKRDELIFKLQKNIKSQELQTKREKLQDKLVATKQAKKAATESMLKHFNTNAASYFAKAMIKDVLSNMSQEEKLDKGIPDMHARTIEFLIKRGTCVCGTKVDFGSEVYNELNKALEYLPPQSIGISIGQFIKESEIRAKTSSDLFHNVAEQYGLIRSLENDIEDLLSEIKAIEEELLTMQDTSKIQQELSRYERILQERQTEMNQLYENKGAYESNRDRLIKLRSELTLRDEKNRKIEIYKAYAQYMYDEISRIYKEKEDETRMKLEDSINEIFKKIYEGGISLSIDDKYNIQVFVSEFDQHNTDVETSTAQSISVIFAFIAGIIKMAHDSGKDNNEEVKMIQAEPYPLVMDAPLSAFDKRRIETVCDVLPKTAEQVIIMIKDTDGELAENYMGSKVGKRYIFDKKNEFEAYVVRR